MAAVDTIRDFAAIVRRRRRELGMSQAQLADAVGRTRQWVSSLESGANGNPALADAIAVALELGLAWDLGRDEAV